MSGPAVAKMSSVSFRVTHGTHPPYPNRTINSIRIGTVPRLPTTMRTTLDEARPPRTGMKSINTTAPPSAVVNAVSTISVLRR